ncbi:PAS domain S-box protein [Rubinisphaera brasiliensis]|uniref:histidine kinase n=1 Tax=Rubinisphaera brasiliensis (strain ATCC 49424 / DSM 5305 / JCM 21570 / IAM 15109 / NBRC 103401 / IFAM 1448) TaxID=756272 RepID=F0SFQ3_RUBBR|nr:PAS domain S-box protein [Rubinisphaera brasiliensis]ADY60513.1 multi-sensor signal transduction histidine kinase [Rubinisphaera brasiliensis DSM 5305]
MKSDFWKRPELPALLLSLLAASVTYFAFSAWQRSGDVRAEEELRERVDYHLAAVQSEVRLAVNRRLQMASAMQSVVEASPELSAEKFRQLAVDMFSRQFDALAALVVENGKLLTVVAGPGFDQSLADQWAEEFVPHEPHSTPLVVGPYKLGDSRNVLEFRFSGFARAVAGEPSDRARRAARSTSVEIALLFDQQRLADEIESVVPGHMALAIQMGTLVQADDFLLGQDWVVRSDPVERRVALPVGEWATYMVPASGWPIRRRAEGISGQLRWIFAFSVGVLTYYLLIKTSYLSEWFATERTGRRIEFTVPGLRGMPVTAALPVLALAVSSVLVSMVLWKQETEEIRRQFQNQAETFVRRSLQQFDRRGEKLELVAGLFRASDRVTDAVFRQFVFDMLNNDAGFFSISWISGQSANEQSDVSDTAAAENAEVEEAAGTGSLQIYDCISPFAGNEWKGFRFWSDAEVRKLIAQTGHRGQLQIVSHDRMADNRLPPHSCPIQITIRKPASRDPAAENLDVVLALMNMEPIFRKEAGLQSYSDVALLVTERCPVNGHQIVYQKGNPLLGDEDLDFTAEITDSVAGRMWTYRFAALPGYVSSARSGAPWLALTAGLLLSTLVGIGTMRLHDRSLKMEEVAAARKGQLNAAEMRLFREREETQLILDSIPSLIFLKDRENLILRVNQSVLDSLGMSRAEVEGRASSELYPNNAEQFYQDDLQVIASGKPKLAFVEPIGDRWVRTDKIPITNVAGEVDRILVIATDVTEQRRAESLVRAWFNASPEGMITARPDGRIALVNDEVCAMFDLSSAALQGMQVEDLFEQTFDEDQGVDLQFLFENPPEQAETITLRLPARSSDERVFPAEVKVTRADTLEGTILLLSLIDQTEVERIEASLRRTEELLKKTSEMARIGGWEFDAITRELHWSDEVCRIHDVPAGFKPTLEQAVQFMTPDSQKLATDAIDEMLKTGKPYDLELEYITASGRQVWGRAIGEPEFKDGKCVRMWGALQDISNYKETERRLQLTRHAVEFSADAVYFIERDGQLRYVNDRACRDLGYTKTEFESMTVSDIAPNVPAERWEEEWQQNKEIGNRLFESIHQRKNGEKFPCQIQTSFLKFESQELIVATVRDITQAKREAELRHTLFERSADAHLLFDETGILECNQAAIDMLRMPDRENLLGRQPFEFSPEYQPNGERSEDLRGKYVAQAYESGSFRFDWIHTRANGEEFPCDVTLTAVELESGPALLLVWHDISERKQAEETQVALTLQVVEANRALERTNAELKEFAYVASHDLQTPLRGISGFAQFLKEDYEGKLDEQADEYLSRISDGAQRMQRLIKDLLAYSQVDLTSSAFASVDLNTLLDDVIGYLRPAIETSAADVTAERLPTVQGNSTQLFQLFQNLVSNSLKYRNQEHTVIQISAEEREEEWVIGVRDNGIGIAPEHHDRIFQIFRRLHTQKEYEGTGVGLALCRRIVERHGGEIWVESDEDNGCCFKFTLPKSGIATTQRLD